MRLIPILAVVIAIGLSMFVLGGLGVSQHFGSGGETGLQDSIQEEAGENESIQSDESSEGGFISFVVGAIGQIRDMVSLILFLPSTLQSWGVPGAAASAIGYGAQFVIALGLIQVALRWEVR